MRDLPADMEVCEEIVDCLGKNACPVDGIDSTEVILLVEGLVCEQRLYNILKGGSYSARGISVSHTQYIPGRHQMYPSRRCCAR